MEQLILHLIGDYLTQSDWMANNKTKKWTPAIIHAFVYSIPFLLIGSCYAVAIIFATHAVIDRFRLVKFLPEFYPSQIPQQHIRSILCPFINFLLDELHPFFFRRSLLFFLNFRFSFSFSPRCPDWKIQRKIIVDPLRCFQLR